MSRVWNDDDYRTPPETWTVRRRLRPGIRLVLKVTFWLLLACLVVVIVAGYLGYRDSTSPRHSCELRGGVYSSDLQTCLRVPR